MTAFVLPISDCQFFHCQLPIADLRSQQSFATLRIELMSILAKTKSAIGNRKSEIRNGRIGNQKSKIKNLKC
jgi:hypothetical protein